MLRVSRWCVASAVLLAAFSLLTLSGCGGSGGTAGLSISGTVIVPDGTPTGDGRQALEGRALPNASVKAYVYPNLNTPIAQGTTNNRGEYSLLVPADAVGKDIVVVATKQVGGNTVRVATICTDLPATGKAGADMDVATTFAVEEIMRVRESAQLTDLAGGGWSSVVQRIRNEIGGAGINLTEVLPANIGAGLRHEGFQEQVSSALQPFQDSLKGSTGDVAIARNMMQTMRDALTTTSGNARSQGSSLEAGVKSATDSLDSQLKSVQAFADRFDVVVDMLGLLDDKTPGEYRLVLRYGYRNLERVGDIPGGKTWKVTSLIEGATYGLVLTVTVQNAISDYRFDPSAGTYAYTVTKPGDAAFNYSGTVSASINESAKTGTMNATFTFRDSALTQPLSFSGTVTLTLRRMPSEEEEPPFTSATFNGTLNSQFGNAQVANLKVEWDPDSAQEDSLKRVTLTKLQVQTSGQRSMAVLLENVDVQVMKLQGGGQAPKSISVGKLQLTAPDEAIQPVSITVSNVTAVGVEWIDPEDRRGHGVIKSLQGTMSLVSQRLSINGELQVDYVNPMPDWMNPEKRLSTYPRGTIRIRGNMTASIGKPGSVDITIISSPNLTPPRVTLTAQISYGGDSMNLTVESNLQEDEWCVETVGVKLTATHSPSGLKMEMTVSEEGQTSGTIKKADGTKVADIGRPSALGLPTELGNITVVKYTDGTFETMESLLQ